MPNEKEISLLEPVYDEIPNSGDRKKTFKFTPETNKTYLFHAFGRAEGEWDRIRFLPRLTINTKEAKSENFGGATIEYKAENTESIVVTVKRDEFTQGLGRFTLRVTVKDSIPNMALALHNYYRKKHGAKELANKPQLNIDAQAWANKRLEEAKNGAYEGTHAKHHLAKDRFSFKYMKGAVQGENIAIKYITADDKHAEWVHVASGIDNWYNEFNDYSYINGKANPGKGFGDIGHFTQVVWAKTGSMGIGIASGKVNIDNKEKSLSIVVARYHEAGNDGKYIENVIDPKNVKPQNGTTQPNPPQPGPTPETGPKAPANLVNIRKAFIEKTNAMRKNHGAAPLTDNETLNDRSQDHAEDMAQDHTFFYLPAVREVGNWETLACRWVPEEPKANELEKLALEVLEDWYAEKSNYNFKYPSLRLDTLHFTQLVWKSSVSHGFGIAYSPKNGINGDEGYEVYIVARYSPAGNVDEVVTKNVSNMPVGVPGLTVGMEPVQGYFGKNDAKHQYAFNAIESKFYQISVTDVDASLFTSIVVSNNGGEQRKHSSPDSDGTPWSTVFKATENGLHRIELKGSIAGTYKISVSTYELDQVINVNKWPFTLKDYLVKDATRVVRFKHKAKVVLNTARLTGIDITENTRPPESRHFNGGGQYERVFPSFWNNHDVVELTFRLASRREGEFKVDFTLHDG